MHYAVVAGETGPNRVFASKTQQLYGKRETWVRPARPAHRSFWVNGQKYFGRFTPWNHPD